MKIKFIPAKSYPKESGQYFWKSCFGDVMLVNVRKLSSEFGYGDWFGVSEFGGKNVERYDVNQFSEKVEFES
jgi:hypothetical protein